MARSTRSTRKRRSRRSGRSSRSKKSSRGRSSGFRAGSRIRPLFANGKYLWVGVSSWDRKKMTGTGYIKSKSWGLGRKVSIYFKKADGKWVLRGKLFRT